MCPRDIEIYLSAVFLCLAAALPHHNVSEDIKQDYAGSSRYFLIYPSVSQLREGIENIEEAR